MLIFQKVINKKVKVNMMIQKVYQHLLQRHKP